jgi:hypothetical protein
MVRSHKRQAVIALVVSLGIITHWEFSISGPECSAGIC